LEIVFEAIKCLVTSLLEMEMKAITMDKVSCYINLRENEEKPKDYQHLTLPGTSYLVVQKRGTHSLWTFCCSGTAYVSTTSQIAF